jgi:KDO2-lipid IV(A) lauroyltransferase
MALYLVIQVGAFLSWIIPRPWRYRIGAAMGVAVYWVWGAKRRILQQNMATILGAAFGDPAARRVAARSMRNYHRYLIEFLELPTLSSRHPAVASMKVDGLEHLQAALAEGRGVLIATAHYGTIEIPGLRLTDFTDFHAVYDSFKPAYLDRLIQRKRREVGIDLIPASNIRRMFQVLHRGGTITLLFDRPVEESKGVPVTFFGRRTAVPGGPAVLAMKTGATLLPVYTVREPDLSFTTTVCPPIRWTPSGKKERDVETIMQRLMDTLQIAVRARPDQWYMFRPMWPEQMPARSAGRTEPATDGPTG